MSYPITSGVAKPIIIACSLVVLIQFVCLLVVLVGSGTGWLALSTMVLTTFIICSFLILLGTVGFALLIITASIRLDEEHAHASSHYYL